MTTARLVASSYSVTGTVVVNQNESSLYTNTDNNSSPARITHTTSGTSSYYLYLSGFNFDSIPSNATVSSITIKVKGYESSLSTSTSYAPRLYYNSSGTTWSTVANASAASSNFGTSTNTITVPYTGDWATLKNYGSTLGIRLVIRRSNRNTQGYLYIYGAEILVEYTAQNVAVTGVSLNKATTSIEVGETETLVATVAPSNASNQSVSWSSGSTSVATVSSSGVVTGVSAGTAVITVTTADGNKTASCTVTVTPAVVVNYVLTDTLVAGDEYLIANGNSGSVYLLSNESAGSKLLAGVSATVSSSQISITQSVAAKTTFTCDLEDNSNSDSTRLKNGTQYLYTDSSNGLRMFTLTSAADGKHWHYVAGTKHLLWFFKDTSGNNGYTDTSSTYKYYLSLSGTNYTDAHVSTTSLENTSTPAIYLYRKDTGETVSVTGVTLNKSTTSLETGQTEQLTATVAPANASDKSVSWSSGSTSVATVSSSGLVTAVSAGTAVITVTTTDGSYTASCTVTVTAPVMTQYRVTDTMVAGKSYLIANGNSGSVYLLSNEANGSRTLKGVSATVTNGIVSISGATASKCLFACVETTSGNSITTGLTIDGEYLYCDSGSGLRMNTVSTLDRFWHYVDNKFWQFKSSSSNGYTDTSSEYKYYLTWSNGDATDSHVSTTSIEASNIPATYLFEEYTPSDTELYVKLNGSWTQVSKAYKKVSGSWQEVALDEAFESGVNYVKGTL